MPATRDVLFPNVKYLCQDGVITDKSQYATAATAFGALTQGSTAQQLFGQPTLAFGANGRLELAAAAKILAGDFTIDGWFYQTARSQVQYLWTQYSNGAGDFANRSAFFVDAAGKLSVQKGAAVLTGATTVTLNAWHFGELTRAGNTLYAFLDGVLQGTLAIAGNMGDFLPCFGHAAGAAAAADTYWQGYMGAMRIEAGTARHTANYAIPTEQLGTMGTLTPTTWNPSDKGASVVLGSGNLAASLLSPGSVRAGYGATSGKWYFELTLSGNNYTLPGVGLVSAPINVPGGNAYPGVDEQGWSVYCFDGRRIHLNGDQSQYLGAGVPAGTVLGVLLDMDARTIGYRVNGVDKGVAWNLPAGQPIYPMAGAAHSTAVSTITANFGASPFAFPVPAGYHAGFGRPLGAISGNVKDANGANAARTVRLYREDTGALVASGVSDASTGNYSINSPYASTHTVEALPAAGELLNALVYSGVMPQ